VSAARIGPSRGGMLMKTLALFGKLVAGTAFALVLAYLFYFGGISAWKITSTQGVSHHV